MTLQRIRRLAVKSIIKYDRIFFFVGVPIGLCLGGLPIVFSLFREITDVIAQTPEVIRNMRLFGIAISVLFLVAAIEHLFKKKSDLRLIQSLSRGLSDIVWVYKGISKGEMYRKNGAGNAQLPLKFCQIYFGYANGKKSHISVSEEQADSVTAFIADNYPAIVVGYSDEAEKLFKKNPLRIHTIELDPKSADERTASVGY